MNTVKTASSSSDSEHGNRVKIEQDLSTHASSLIIYTKTLLEYANSACHDFIHDIASRMESQGIPGEIQVSEATYQLLKDKLIFERRGPIEVKGKGEMVTYLLKR